ncbi:MAG TPA: FAD:protein FMN transferase [Acidimicrobiales bacterium]
MASDITVHGRVDDDDRQTTPALERALRVFSTVDTTCTRFVPTSPLMVMNARPDRWHRVPETLFRAVVEAHLSYQRTHGRFDPRVLQDLLRLGYDGNLAFGGVETVTPFRSGVRRPLGPWRPRFRGGPHPELHLGGIPIELGGIGKGLAVRWASELLKTERDSFLIEAGGDCAAVGVGPDGGGWRVGVEHPGSASDPLAVVELVDAACATSSTRIRHWRSGDADVHHLIDPRSGASGGQGLLSVTVVADDPADAEVTSKTLFLEGRKDIAAEARRRNIAALWVDTEGRVAESPRLAPHVIWRAA